MEHKAKLSSTHSDEKKIAKELKIAQNVNDCGFIVRYPT